jgi:hypothetical protein
MQLVILQDKFVLHLWLLLVRVRHEHERPKRSLTRIIYPHMSTHCSDLQILEKAEGAEAQAALPRLTGSGVQDACPLVVPVVRDDARHVCLCCICDSQILEKAEDAEAEAALPRLTGIGLL